MRDEWICNICCFLVGAIFFGMIFYAYGKEQAFQKIITEECWLIKPDQTIACYLPIEE